MRTSVKTIVLAAGLLLAATHAAPALAAGENDKAVKDAETMFATMDTNKDGVLTQEEFAAHGMAADFAKSDKNGDGKVTKEEYVGYAASMKAMPGM